MNDARLPRLFGKYTLLKPLARGGMGEIYLAAAGDLGGAEKLCVIKKLPEKIGPVEREPQQSRRFLDEARVMVRLNHVNLVQVFDAGQVDGELYLAMELVAGRDLRAAWNRCADLKARIPVDMALYLVREVARGLAFAHSYGGLHLVHRDVAPPNILCSWQGEVKVTDFGLAASRLKSEKTGPGIVFGRLGYLAPEQARGEQADRRTDVYALGVILWELLTGRPLIDPTADAAETLRSIRTATADPPSRHAADLPPSLDAVVLRALSPSRESRFATADEIRQAVSRELLKLSPDADQSCVVNFLRGLYGDEIEREQAEQERLLRQELPRLRAHFAPALPQATPPAPVAEAGDAMAAAQQRLNQVIDGRYRLDRLIGMGGMGAVYEAEHIAIRKKVALKVLHRHFSQQADLVRRFLREAQAASRIGHPNIIDVTDFGYTQDGSAYLVMEHLIGTDLGVVLEQQHRLSQGRALHIIVQLGRALSAAHTASVIHRDLKPENIFLVDPEEAAGGDREAGRARDLVKVLDFGIAMKLDPSMPIRLTQPGLTVGTPEYMAPEQGTGETVDARADIYSVGAILYEMVTGRLPHAGGSVAELLTRKMHEPPPAPLSLRPDLHPRLDQLIQQCLKCDPLARPQSMDDLLRELLPIQSELSQDRAPEQRPRVVTIEAKKAEAPGTGEPTVELRREKVPRRPSKQPPPPPRPGTRKQTPALPVAAAAAPEVAATLIDLPGPPPAPADPVKPEDPPADAPDIAAVEAAEEKRRQRMSVSGQIEVLSVLLPQPLGMPAADLIRERPLSGPIKPSFAPPQPRQKPPPWRSPPAWGLYAGIPLAAVLLLSIGFAGARLFFRGTEVPSQHPSSIPPSPRKPADPRSPRPPPGGEAGKGGPAALIEWARHAADNGRYMAPPGDNLVELLLRIEAIAPGHPEAKKLREETVAQVAQQGRDALHHKDPAEALRRYRILSALDSGAPFPRTDLSYQLQLQARAQNTRKGRQRALDSAMGAVEVAPDSVAARLILGEVYLASGQRDEAGTQFRRALELHPYAAEERMARTGLAKTKRARKGRSRG